MARDYAIYDVFTDKALSGNGLAVVFDAEGLEAERMQAIAREFNLSETAFVLPAEEQAQSARVRIFTPGGELPFAGHPTVGTAVALADRDGNGDVDHLYVLGEGIGNVRTVVRYEDGLGYAEFDLPRLPEAFDCDIDKAVIAAAIGLDPTDIGFENHVVSGWSAGNPIVCIPVRGLEQAARVHFDVNQWLDLFGGGAVKECPYVYCRETVNHDAAFHVRMFAPHHGIPEDPATGSAAAAFAGAIHRFDGLPEGAKAFLIEQGGEMGRPSRIRLEIDGHNGDIHAARIGGFAVKTAEGRLFV